MSNIKFFFIFYNLEQDFPIEPVDPNIAIFHSHEVKRKYVKTPPGIANNTPSNLSKTPP